ncbi:MAG: sigma-70 family RNA polymerase sigma factor [Kiritimatiellae bacterium]|nr:sigma-70 family RNA polymerase sigma factor [Kiritimatiellia bacterium]
MSALSQKDVMRAAFQYREALVAYAYGLLRDWALAEDVVQEAYLVLLDKWREYKPEYKVYTWVRKMVYFKVQEMYRARRREVISEDEELFGLVTQAVDRHLDEEAAERQNVMLRALRECVGRLSAGSASLLTKYYWDRQSCEAIARSVERTVNAIWLSLSRIRKKLRECVADRLAETAS